MPGNDLFENAPMPEGVRPQARRPGSYAGMGYRLAAAGPRTRQRLIERESGFPPPDEVRYAQGAGAVGNGTAFADAGPDAHGWAPPAPDAEADRLVRVSTGIHRHTVWRAVALLASAACGFSMVLFGQSLHLDKTLHSGTKRHDMLAAAMRATDAQVPAPDGNTARAPDAQAAANALDGQNAAASANPQYAARGSDAQDAPAVPEVKEASLDARELAPAADIVRPDALEAGTRMLALAAQAPAAALEETPADARRLPVRLVAVTHGSGIVAALAAPRRVVVITASPGWRSQARQPVLHPAGAHYAPLREMPVHVAALHEPPARYVLPAWLTRPQDTRPKVLVMSPPPHDLDAPPGSEVSGETAVAQAAPRPRLPPAPEAGAHGPPIIYAEAHYAPAPPQSQVPPPRPYYQPYYQPYYPGYYGYAPYPYPYPRSW